MAGYAKRNRPTLAQVAERAGVSRSAAGFVLSGRDDQRISQKVWKRVEQAAKELGYRPNATARALSTGVSDSILLVSDYIATTGTANSMITGILDSAWKSKKSVLLVETRGHTDIEHKAIADMLDRQIDAAIYASMFTRGVEIPEELKDTPTVLLNCWTDVRRYSSVIGSVVPDEIKAGKELIELALKHGYTDGIAFLGDITKSPFNDWMPLAFAKRLEGMCTILHEHALPSPELIGVQDWTVKAGYAAVRRRLEEDSPIKLLICANDQLALGAYRALSEMGIHIGRGVGVASFGNSDMASWVEPGLTSVCLPHYRMGFQAMEMLAKYLTDSNDFSFIKSSIPMEIIERESL